MGGSNSFIFIFYWKELNFYCVCRTAGVELVACGQVMSGEPPAYVSSDEDDIDEEITPQNVRSVPYRAPPPGLEPPAGRCVYTASFRLTPPTTRCSRAVLLGIMMLRHTIRSISPCGAFV